MLKFMNLLNINNISNLERKFKAKIWLCTYVCMCTYDKPMIIKNQRLEPQYTKQIRGKIFHAY